MYDKKNRIIEYIELTSDQLILLDSIDTITFLDLKKSTYEILLKFEALKGSQVLGSIQTLIIRSHIHIPPNDLATICSRLMTSI